MTSPAKAPAASPPSAVREFLETEDLALLEKPLVFERDEAFNSYLCCLGVCSCVGSLGVSLLCPIQTCCPSQLFDHFSLKLSKDAVQLSSAGNDCCCHIATSVKTVPLEKIQDVELATNWLMSMFGVQLVSVQTAGTGGISAEIQAAFLKDPAQAREAIRLAVKLRHQTETAAPAQQPAMERGSRGGQGRLAQRLRRLELLAQRGVLAQEEALSVRAALLAAEHDVTELLLEAADLEAQGLITAEELAQMKAKWLASV